MIHERRIYHAAPKQLGKLVARFNNHNLRIYERLGIKTIAAWTVVVGEANDQLIYLLEWDSLTEREEKWASFMQDEEWQEIWTETDSDGALVRYASNEFLAPVMSKLAS